MCDEKTFDDECLLAKDFNENGKDIPLCSTCEKHPYRYINAITFAKAVWNN